MPSLFYEKQVEIGENGEKLGLLFVDSSLMLCATYSYAGDSGGHMLLMHEEHIRLRDVHCNTDEQQFWGNRQYEWINETLAGWQHDKDLVWKAAVLHHPLWGKWYPDFAPIVLNFLPILLDNQFDLYLCGHEHVVSYASYAYSQVPLPTLEGLKHNMKEHAMLEEYQCKADQESLFGKTSRKQTWLKGEALH